MNEEFLTTGEVAQQFKTTPRHIRALRERGDLCYVTIGRLVRFRANDVDEYVRSRQVQR